MACKPRNVSYYSGVLGIQRDDVSGRQYWRSSVHKYGDFMKRRLPIVDSFVSDQENGRLFTTRLESLHGVTF